VAHTCNPTYSAGKNQEDGSLKPAQANNLRDPISEIPNTKKDGGVAHGVGPEFKLQYCKKKKNKKGERERERERRIYTSSKIF
jgi:hypothetical protein